jgi:hypothetical protein
MAEAPFTEAKYFVGQSDSIANLVQRTLIVTRSEATHAANQKIGPSPISVGALISLLL